jgi:hypothetical protein
MRARFLSSLLVLAMLAAVTGCTTVKRATGQLDDTVLPGEREEVLPPEQQTARDPSVMGKSNSDTLSGDTMQDDSLQSEQAECLPEEPNCIQQQPLKPKKSSTAIQ